jgi:hypothetical protein
MVQLKKKYDQLKGTTETPAGNPKAPYGQDRAIELMHMIESEFKVGV